MSDGETVPEFYTRALIMSNEIELQQDHTGQNYWLIRSFVHLLFHYSPSVECLRPVMTQLNSVFSDPDNHLIYFPLSLEIIYQHHLID